MSIARRIAKECIQLKQNPPDNIRISFSDSDVFDVVGYVQGPEGTPYEDGFFKVKFNFGADFPNSPPNCTRIIDYVNPRLQLSRQDANQDIPPKYQQDR